MTTQQTQLFFGSYNKNEARKSLRTFSMSFSYIFRFQNSISEYSKNAWSSWKIKIQEKAKRISRHKKAVLVTENTHVSRSEPKIIQSPEKVNKSFEKISTNCPILNEERNTLWTRNKSFQLGIVNSSRQPIKANSNVIKLLVVKYCKIV